MEYGEWFFFVFLGKTGKVMCLCSMISIEALHLRFDARYIKVNLKTCPMQINLKKKKEKKTCPMRIIKK